MSTENEVSNESAVESDELESEDIEQLDEAYPEPSPIAYTGSDFDVEGLVRRLKRGDIKIPSFGHGDDSIETAGFQRDFVWRRPQMDRFIESLLLGYPVPGIFLVQQRDKRYLVLDGQQRLRTLAHFYEGTFGNRVFQLTSVADVFKGLTYKSLDDQLRRTLDNTFIQAIVVQTDGTTASLESVYQIFERLNSGGTMLTAHEIRVALYAGPFVDFIASLNEIPVWRQLYGNKSPRLRDQELILRIFALYRSPETYKRPLKKYLNEFCGTHRNLSGLNSDSLREAFTKACTCIIEGPGKMAFRHASKQVNVALTEAIMVGILKKIDGGNPVSGQAVGLAIKALTGDTDFIEAITRATSDEERVKKRLGLATKEFAKI